MSMMKRHFCSVLSALLALTLVASPALAQKWTILGVKKVQFKGELDEIYVGKSQGSFRGIKLKVDGAGVHFRKVVVVFGNGQRFEAPMRDNIEAGGQTRVIDLPGRARIIQKIVFAYKTHRGSHKKATVTVLGYKG
jgi:hypothetical protein